MKLIYFLLLLPCYIYAAQLPTIYRDHGIEAVTKELDRTLGTLSYWEKELQNFDTTFGYFENITSILTCDKDRSKLYQYTLNQDNHFHLTHTFGAMTGKVNGDKQQEGDNKTPLGVYTLTKKIVNPDPFYGPLAYVTSYPNLYDKVRGKNGSGIWIHGVPLQGDREKFTKGCIAIDNEDICALDETLSLQKSILIIDQEHAKEAASNTLALILSKLFTWRYAWLYNDYESYISFYANSFIRFDGMQYSEFKQYKRRVFDYNDKKTITFSNIIVVPYPGEEKDLYMIMFDEDYRSKRIAFSGKKTLIIRYTAESIAIIAER
jgi:murein L,D-transpeptidase YafK